MPIWEMSRRDNILTRSIEDLRTRTIHSSYISLVMRRDIFQDFPPKVKDMERKERIRGIILIPPNIMNQLRREKENILQVMKSIHCNYPTRMI